MRDKLPRNVKLQCLELDAQGNKQADIAATTGVSISTITRAKGKMKQYGDIEGGKQKRGPSSKMDPGMETVISLFGTINDPGRACNGLRSS
jgi:transposase